MMFECTLRNVNGTVFNVVTDKFFEPATNIMYMGISCYVENVEPFMSVDCSELAFSNSCYRNYGFY